MSVRIRNNNRMRISLLALSFLLFPASAFAAGTVLPDLGQGMLLILLVGFCAVFCVWFVLRLTPSWRNRLSTNPKLRTLSVFNVLALLVVLAATVVCLVIEPFMLLIVGFAGIPVLGVTMGIELAWGWSLSRSKSL